MTREKKVLVDISDPFSLVFQCSDCGGRITIPADSEVNHERLAQCPGCGNEWFRSHEAAQAYWQLLRSLRDVRANQKGRPFSVRVEFEDSD